MFDVFILELIKSGVVVLFFLIIYKLGLFISYIETEDKFYCFFYYPVNNIVFTKDSKIRKKKKYQNQITKWLLVYCFSYLLLITSVLYPDYIELILKNFTHDIKGYWQG